MSLPLKNSTAMTASAPWWQQQREPLLQLARSGPSYVYSASEVRAAAKRMLALPLARVFYASKANHHPHVLRTLFAAGIGIECVSPGEVEHARQHIDGLTVSDILFTPNFAPRAEYEWAVQQGLRLTLDSLYPLQHWPEVFTDQDILLRVDPGTGAGHHSYVKTGGDESKFGIRLADMAQAAELALAAGAHVIGLHAHAGSGIHEAGHWLAMGRILGELLPLFPEVKIFNIGGGLGVPVEHGDAALDMAIVAQGLRTLQTAFPDIALWMEPGRYLVAQAGVLLTRVTQIKGKGDYAYVGVDTGMNSLLRPALYQAHHPVFNLTRLAEPATQTVHVVGPICESADKLAIAAKLPQCFEGDVLMLTNAGAYGRVMSSHYNLRAPAREVFID